MKRSILLLCALAFGLAAQSQIEISKANMQFDMRDYRAAIESYQQALEKEPENVEVCAKIAECYLQLQDNLQASQWYEKIVDQATVKPEHILNYGHVLKSLRLYAKAKFYYQKYAQYDAHVARHFIQSCDLAKAEMDGPELYEIDALAVNTPFSEFGLSVVDGNFLFNSFRTDIEAKRKAENASTGLNIENELFVAPNYGKKAVRHFMRPVRGEQGVGNVHYSGNGKWVVFDKNDLRSGQRLFDARPGKTSVFIGEINEKGEWTSVRPFAYNSNEHATGYPCLSHDGSVMYFASTRPGGYGGWDLYVSFKSNSGWTAPQNLGPTVNTPGHEIAPYYVNRKLYFSSDWHAGLGGFDIFKAVSNEGQWTSVRSMGYPLNSPKDDIGFYWDEELEQGFFASNRIGGQGQYDLYSGTPLYDEITMIVREQGGEKPVNGAVIRYANNQLPSTVTDKNGFAVIHQPRQGVRDIVVAHDGYRELRMQLRAEAEGPSRYEVYIDKAPAQVTSDPSEVETLVENNHSDEPTPVTDDKTPDIKKTTKPVVEHKPAIVKSKETASTVTSFAVQVAALGRASNLAQYEKLERFGSVMQVPEGKYHKIRVGYFKSEQEARAALGKIKSVGYPDAFVVRTASNGVSAIERSAPVKNAAPEKYMVRLATYAKPGNFDSSKVEHLGAIESYRQNQMTIMLLSGYSTISQAEEAREGAFHQGFKDAFVVVKRDGQLQKVTTAVTER